MRKSGKEKRQRRVAATPTVPDAPATDVPRTTRDTSATGIDGFDRITGGGFPKGSVVLLAGGSGSGKTIFCFSWLFEGVRNNENSVYVTFTEPVFRTVKNLEQMVFYERQALEQDALAIVDLRERFPKAFDQKKFLAIIEEEVTRRNAKRLCIDSITAILYQLNDRAKIRQFVFELGKLLATLGCTTFLTSETAEEGTFSAFGVAEFMADAIVELSQVKQRGELQRSMQIIKIRGRAYRPEACHFTISSRGITVYPKLSVKLESGVSEERASIGNPFLDKLLLGGLYRGSTTLVSGSSGTGKSLLCMQFLVDGIRRKEQCLYIGFEESKAQLVRNAKGFGWDLENHEKEGRLVFRCMYPADKNIEEHLFDIKTLVENHKPTRCVVDSLSAIGALFAEDAYGTFARTLNGYLKMQGVTTIVTSTSGTPVGAVTMSETQLSTMTDNIILLRHVEIQGALRQVINIIKVRGSAHSKGLHIYDITDKGISIGESLSGYEGIVAGVARKVSETTEEQLQAEFKRYIGPMAGSVFDELKAGGLTTAAVLTYIDKLVADDILNAHDAAQFKSRVSGLLETGKTGTKESFSAPQEETAPRKKKPAAGVIQRWLG